MKVLFWLTQAIFGLLIALFLLDHFGFFQYTENQLNLIALTLIWIACSLTWGLGALLAKLAELGPAQKDAAKATIGGLWSTPR